MKVGSGKAVLRFEENFFPTEGFTEQLDEIHARVLLVQEQEKICILSLEMTSLAADTVTDLKEIIGKAADVDRERIWVCVTHTFSVPHILPDEALRSDEEKEKKEKLKTIVYDAVTAAAREAAGHMEEVKLFLGDAVCDVNCNRDFETPDGWWIGNCGQGPSDKRVTTLKFVSQEGKILALLWHYAVQSSILDGSRTTPYGKSVSSDLAGNVSARLEKQYPGCVALFMVGAAGDQAPVKKANVMKLNPDGELIEIDLKEKAIPFVEELGLKLSEAVKEAAELGQEIPDVEIRTGRNEFDVPQKVMNWNRSELKPARTGEYQPDGKQTICVEGVRIGSVALIGVKPELNCITASQIEKLSSDRRILICTMVNGGAKYMADKDSYDRFTYEAMNSPFGRGAAEILCRYAVELTDSLYR